MRSVCVDENEADQYLDKGLGILARIIARDIARKRSINGDVKNDSNDRDVQDE